METVRSVVRIGTRDHPHSHKGGEGAYPNYPVELMLRITKAKDSAAISGHRAWYLGRSSITGADGYSVYSSTNKDGQPYLVRVFDHYVVGTFCYDEGRVGPLVWLMCECKAAENGQPCRHSATVYMRLERENGLKHAGERG